MNNETCPVCGLPDNCGDCNHEGGDPYGIRLEAERLIGEDRVPTDVLLEIVRDFGG